MCKIHFNVKTVRGGVTSYGSVVIGDMEFKMLRVFGVEFERGEVLDTI